MRLAEPSVPQGRRCREAAGSAITSRFWHRSWGAVAEGYSGIRMRSLIGYPRAAAGPGSSTVSREINRHGGRGAYRAARAEERAGDRAQRPQRCLLAMNERLRDLVQARLEEHWSPEQISGWLRAAHPDDEGLRISPETIHRSLFVQSRQVLAQELIGRLRSGRATRRSKRREHLGRDVADTDAVPVADGRSRWQAGGARALGRRPDSRQQEHARRHARGAAFAQVADKDTDGVASALIEQLGRLPSALRSTLTWERRMEIEASAVGESCACGGHGR